jgi:HEAT repeat protein
VFGMNTRAFISLSVSSVFFVAALLGCKESAATAVPKLVKQLKSQVVHERYLAAKSLGDYEEEAEPAVDPLIRTLWDDNMGVRTAAAFSLTKIGSPKALKALEFYKREKERQNKLTGEQGEEESGK